MTKTAYIPTITINKALGKHPEISYRVKIEGSDGKTYIGTLMPKDELAITIQMDSGELMRFEAD